ncbi:hypothetical protein ACOSP7_000579 [Xanthoceras sorbifolium]
MAVDQSQSNSMADKDKNKQVLSEGKTKQLQAKPQTDGKVVTILSIDGGGARTIIPAVILDVLEKKLQEIDHDDNLRISDYFDVVAGSGTGSIVAALLTTPVDTKQDCRPLFSMPQIVDSLVDMFKITFSEQDVKSSPPEDKKNDRKGKTLWERAKEIFNWGHRKLFHAENAGKDDLKNIMRKNLNDTLLMETLSEVVVPVYNFRNTRPFVFSSSQTRELRQNGYGDIKLVDVVLASSAMPMVLPLHSITYQETPLKFADGGLVSTNPTLLALQEAEKLYGSEADYKNYLVLSLGTAKRSPVPETIWRIPQWLYGLVISRFWRDWGGRLLHYVYDTFSDITETYISLLLQCRKDNKNYLRIQEHVPEDDVPSMVDGSDDSIKKLKEIGEKILGKPAAYMNPYTGVYEEQILSNKAVLEEFANKLSRERKRRLALPVYNI